MLDYKNSSVNINDPAFNEILRSLYLNAEIRLDQINNIDEICKLLNLNFQESESIKDLHAR